MAAGVYIHIPFCISRCSYCDFATDILRDADNVQRYVDALIAEIGDAEFNIDKFADTIYFGGGTPSLLTPEQLGSILDEVRTRFVISNDAEVTVEPRRPSSLLDYVLANLSLASVESDDEPARSSGPPVPGPLRAAAATAYTISSAQEGIPMALAPELFIPH